MIKNGISNAAINLSAPLINLITIPIATKALGVQSFGEASIALSIVSYFTIITTLGLAVYGTRELAQVKDNKDKLATTFSELLALSILASFVGALIYTITTTLFFTITPIVIAIGAFSLALNFLNIEWLYYSNENYKIVAYGTILARLIGLVLVYVLVNDSSDAAIYIGALLLSNALPALFIFSRYKDYTRIVIYNLKISKHLKPIGDFISIRVFSSVYTVLDTVIVGLVSGASTAGLYTVAIRVARIVTSVVCSLTAVAMPRAATLYVVEDKKDYNLHLADTLIITIILSSSAAVTTLLLSRVIIIYLGGDEFESSRTALAFLSFLVPIVGLSNFISMQILYPMKKERLVLVSIGLGSISTLILMPLFIKEYQLDGASFAILLAELVILLTQTYLARHSINALYLSCRPRLKNVMLLTAIFYVESIIAYSIFQNHEASLIIVITSILLLTYIVGLIFLKEPLVKSVIKGSRL